MIAVGDIVPASCTVAIEDSRNSVLSVRAAGLPVVVPPSAYAISEDSPAQAAAVTDPGEPDRPFTPVQGDVHGRCWVGPGLLCIWASAGPVAVACV